MLEFKNFNIDIPGLNEDIFFEDFTFSSGNIIPIMGANGRGKSTFIRNLVELKTDQKDSLFFNSRRLSDLGRIEFAREFSFLFSTHPDTGFLRVKDLMRTPFTIAFPELTKLEVESKIDDALKKLSVSDLKEMIFTSLSDGQKQRVMIAKSLCFGAKVLIFDEPTSYLDFSSQLELSLILKDYVLKNEAILLFVTHDSQFAFSLAPYFLLFDKRIPHYESFISLRGEEKVHTYPIKRIELCFKNELLDLYNSRSSALNLLGVYHDETNYNKIELNQDLFVLNTHLKFKTLGELLFYLTNKVNI